MDDKNITDNHVTSEYLLSNKENSRYIDGMERARATQYSLLNCVPLGELTKGYNPNNDRVLTKKIKPKTVVNGKRAKKRKLVTNEVSALLFKSPEFMDENKAKTSNVLSKEEQDIGNMNAESTENDLEKSSNDAKDVEMVELKPVSNGKSLKKQPEILCSCPLQCNKRIGVNWRRDLYQQFLGMEDYLHQNQFIQRHIKIKSIPQQSSTGENSDKRIHKRVTCKYLVPMSGSINDSYSYAKTLSYDTVKSCLYSSSDEETAKESLNKSKSTAEDSCSTEDIQTDSPSMLTSTLPLLNGRRDPVQETRKREVYDVNSPMSFNDSDSVSTSFDDGNDSDGENKTTKSVKYIEVCQKTFMNIFGLTEKRIRRQREGLIDRSRKIAEEKQKEREENERTLDLARNLGAGCQPLFALLEETNCLHLCNQLLSDIEADVVLVDDFFRDTLWKPEAMKMKESIQASSSEQNALELFDCD